MKGVKRLSRHHRRWLGRWHLRSRWLLLASLVALAAWVGTVRARRASHPPLLRHVSFVSALDVEQVMSREDTGVVPLDSSLRRRGFNECNPYDVLGLGPYTPFHSVFKGHMAIPRVGGHTPDMGYDVLIHFHGYAALAKTLVQVSRGMVYVGVDLGLGSGAYSEAFQARGAYEQLMGSITSELRKLTGDRRAHVRHVALSAWSAGYGAVVELLRQRASDVDAVILLDGLHASWRPGGAKTGRVQDIEPIGIAPVLAYAERALRGEAIFVFTHSEILPPGYPSTQITADWMIDYLGLSGAVQEHQQEGPYAITRTVDVQGLHIWSFAGNDKPAHCSHISHIAPVLHDLIEPLWDTPPMVRDLEPTPPPPIGVGFVPAEGAAPAEANDAAPAGFRAPTEE